MRKLFVTFLISMALLPVFSQQYRYTNSIFSSTTKNADVVYGSSDSLLSPYYDETNTATGNLVMDIYEPSGDAATNRPAIIFAHGGGFVEGDRNHDDMVAFCDTFALKGYVTATIDYRQGVYTLSDAEMHYTRAVYRGMQDGRTAVRFLRANAATYGINPDKIYFVGSSAGAFIGLQNIYMDEVSEKPVYAGEYTYGSFPSITAPDLGDYDIGQNLSYNGEPDAVVGLWGAIETPDLITIDNNEPVFLVHGTTDDVVPFDIGPPFNVSTFPDTYGSNQINNKLISLGLTDKETYFVINEGHEFYGVSNGDFDDDGVPGPNAYWDTVVEMTNTFLHNLHKPTADFNYSASGLTVDFTDQSTGAVSWLWDFGDGNTSASQNPSHTYASDGIYNAVLYIENNIESWDTISYTISAYAATTWDGSSWSNGAPDAATNVVIDADYTTTATLDCNDLTINAGNNFTADHTVNVNGNLLLKSDAGGSASLLDNGNISIATKGTATVQQYLTDSRWWYISPQISGANAGDDLFVDGSDYHLYYWNENNAGFDGWIALSAVNSLDVLKGYAYYNNSGSPVTGEFSGSLNTGTLGSVDNLSRSTGATKEGYNLVGNPYPSAIDWGSENNPTTGVTKTNLNNTIWVRNNGIFATYNWSGDGTSQNGGSQYIAAGQAFWVRVSNGSTNGTFSLTNDARLHHSQPLLKNSKPNIFSIQLSNQGFSDETVIGFYDLANNEYDDYDSEKMFTENAEFPQLYSVLNGKELAINGFNKDIAEQLVVPLGYKTELAGELKFDVGTIQDFDPSINVYLEDKLNNKTIDLRKEPVYTFFTDAPVNNVNRFNLVFTTGTIGIEQERNQNLDVFVHHNTIYLNSPISDHASILVSDLTGRRVFNKDLQLNKGINSFSLNKNLSGVFLINVVTNKNNITKKVIIR